MAMRFKEERKVNLFNCKCHKLILALPSNDDVDVVAFVPIGVLVESVSY